MTQNNAPSAHLDLAALYDGVLAEFTNSVTAQRFWHILPAAGGSATGLFDACSRLRYPTAAALGEFLQAHPFLSLREWNQTNYLATLHSVSGRLWAQPANNSERPLINGKQFVAGLNWCGLNDWRLPTKDWLYQFASSDGNPHRSGDRYRLDSEYRWLTSGGRCDVDENSWRVDSSATGRIFACHEHWVGAGPDAMLVDLADRGWQLATPDGQHRFAPDARWQGLGPETLMHALQDAGLHLMSLDGTMRLAGDNGLSLLADLDYTPCRLPRLEPAQLADPHRGLWELWGNRAEVLKHHGLVARDPARDLCTHNVAIDFGTSSTVVALADAHGGRRLLRIGVRDFYQTPRASDFENPTVLEVIDYEQLYAAWTARAYRPALDWVWLHAAHEAQESFRGNPGDTEVLASILPRMKQWALRSEKEALRLTDRRGREIELPALSERNPVRGQPLAVNPADPFDPIELYAWFLGMAINWRGHGLHSKYHLTFPVKYPRAAKDKMLSSFRRGLQRSLPATLAAQPEALDAFEVCEIASEPAAYAAAALPQLGLAPDQSGVPYAVFDFGGGTTDFDFGLWRWANADEQDEGYDQVFEHLHSSGDNFLGGENLLEHLVYACFRANLDVCRQQKIHFTRPLGGERFTGDEAFVHPTQAAQTNTVLVAAKLRDFLERADSQLATQLNIDLLDKDGQKRPCEMSLDKEALDQLLFDRMEEGVRAFFDALGQVRGELPAGATLQVLLAGNGSRSRHITALFDPQGEHLSRLLQEKLGPQGSYDLHIHPPLPLDENNHHAPTAKTGVALGLLRLCPGEGVKLIDRVRSASHDEAPFRYFVGRVGRREEFAATLTPGTPCGVWHALGKLQQGVFKLCFSVSPRARTGLRLGDTELRARRLDFPAARPGDQLFARAIGPTTIELAAAPDLAALESNAGLPQQSLDLETV